MVSEWGLLVIAVVAIVISVIYVHEEAPHRPAFIVPGRHRMVGNSTLSFAAKASDASTPTVHSPAPKLASGARAEKPSTLADRARHDGSQKDVGRHEVRKQITIHGNTSEFELKDIKLVNVVSVELVAANFPRSQYTIDKHNQHLDYRIGSGSVETVTLPPGNNYTAKSIECYLTNNTPLIFQYHAETSKFFVSSRDGSSFTLMFGTGPNRQTSICRELGFEIKDYEGLLFTDEEILPTACVRSPNRADISGARFIHVLTKELDMLHQRGLLAEVPVLPPAPFGVFKPGSVDSRKFENPVTLNRLSFRICDYDAAKNTLVPYNFNGMYWSITVEVTTMDRNVPMEMLSTAENDWHDVHPVYRATEAGVAESKL